MTSRTAMAWVAAGLALLTGPAGAVESGAGSWRTRSQWPGRASRRSPSRRRGRPLSARPGEGTLPSLATATHEPDGTFALGVAATAPSGIQPHDLGGRGGAAGPEAPVRAGRIRRSRRRDGGARGSPRGPRGGCSPGGPVVGAMVTFGWAPAAAGSARPATPASLSRRPPEPTAPSASRRPPNGGTGCSSRPPASRWWSCPDCAPARCDPWPSPSAAWSRGRSSWPTRSRRRRAPSCASRERSAAAGPRAGPTARSSWKACPAREEGSWPTPASVAAARSRRRPARAGRWSSSSPPRPCAAAWSTPTPGRPLRASG